MKKKLVYILSDISESRIFNQIFAAIREQLQLSVILINAHANSPIENFLKESGIPHVSIACKGKAQWPSTILKIAGVLRKWKPDIVHCHLQTANITGLLAARLSNVPTRIFTRHHGSEHHIAKKGVRLDKFISSHATHIIAPSGSVKEILEEWEHVPSGKVVYIPHGFQLEDFSEVSPDRVGAFRKKYQIEGRRPVIGVISRFSVQKGIQYVIPAFQKIQETFPEAVLILLNATGPYESEIRSLAESIPQKNIRLIRFESDIAAAYKAMDVFLHVPTDPFYEAFGQIYVEALAAGIPSVFTISGIAKDFIRNGSNAVVVDHSSSDQIFAALMRLLTEPYFAEKLVKEGKESVKQFNFQRLVTNLTALYQLSNDESKS